MTAAIVVLSGGMDSTTALHYARALHGDMDAVSVDYGQRHRVELDYAARTCRALGVRHDVLDAGALGLLLDGSALTGSAAVPHGHYTAESMTATVVPNRNAILLNIAAGVALSRDVGVIYTGIHAGDHAIYADCRPEFIAAVQTLLDVSTEQRVRVEAPFVHVGKHDIVRAGHALGVDWSLTWSCYEGGRQHCGRCGTCVERAEAFALAGVPDPTTYDDPTYWRDATERTA